MFVPKYSLGVKSNWASIVSSFNIKNDAIFILGKNVSVAGGEPHTFASCVIVTQEKHGQGTPFRREMYRCDYCDGFAVISATVSLRPS